MPLKVIGAILRHDTYFLSYMEPINRGCITRFSKKTCLRWARNPPLNNFSTLTVSQVPGTTPVLSRPSCRSDFDPVFGRRLTVTMNKFFKRSDHSTRGSSIKDERERFLSMAKEEKRKLYKCDKFNTLHDIDSWPEYFEESKDRLIKEVTGKAPLYEVNEEINQQVSIWKGDITTLEIDSICNAANNSLLGGGGVDGAVHRGAGSQLKAECATLGGCNTGDAKITCGYKLPARYIIHTVGPIGEKKPELQSCYQKCLMLVSQHHLTATAFPCISTGIYGYNNVKAAPVVLSLVREWLESDKKPKEFSRIIFCLFLPKDVALYESLMQLYFPTAGSAKPQTDNEKTADKEPDKEPVDNEPKSEDKPETEAKDISPKAEDKPEKAKEDMKESKLAEDAVSEESSEAEDSKKEEPLSSIEVKAEKKDTDLAKDTLDTEVKEMDTKAGEMDLKAKDKNCESGGQGSPSHSPQAKRIHSDVEEEGEKQAVDL